MAYLLILLATPALALVGGLLYATILFWPTMLIFGALHSWVVWVPAFGWQPTFLILVLLYLLIPTASGSTSD